MNVNPLLIAAFLLAAGCADEEDKASSDCLENPYATLTVAAPSETMAPSGTIALASTQNFSAQVSWRISPDDGKIMLSEPTQQGMTSKVAASTTAALTVGDSYTFIASGGIGGGYCPMEDSVTLTVGEGYTTSDCGAGLGMRIGTTCWANANVDDSGKFATRPDMYTKFYQWNKGKAWAATGEVAGWKNPTYYVDGATGMVRYENPCPEGWRMPTDAEYQTLYNAGNMWVNANTRGNAVAGRFYGSNHATCSLPDNMVGCVFLPAAGSRYSSNGNLGNQGVSGGYWSSSEGGQVYEAIHFNFASNDIDVWNSTRIINRAQGLTIRCVRN